MVSNNSLNVFCITFSLFLLTGCSKLSYHSDQPIDCFSNKWAHEKVQLSHDKSVTYGSFENGFRYALMKNGEPKNRVNMYLYTGAGSLQENDWQRGGAHYLEHMMFNGTENFAPGEMVNYFQSIGMGFGADANAFTTQNSTVYYLVLPKGDETSLQQGLKVFGDFAGGLRMTDVEVEKERGVILSEMRARDSVAYRTSLAVLEETTKGTLLAERMPIGTKESIEKMSRQDLQDFYDSWYRPENMFFVAVGDFEVEELESLLAQYFGELTARAPRPQCVELGNLTNRQMQPYFLYHHEPESSSVSVDLQRAWNITPEDDSESLRQQRLVDGLISRMIRLRLKEVLEINSVPFTSATFSMGTMYDAFGYAGIQAESQPQKWQETMYVLKQVLEQVATDGFSTDEIMRVKEETTQSLDLAVSRAETRSSGSLASSLLHSISQDQVFMSPVQKKELFTRLLKNIDEALLEDHFRESWKKGNYYVILTGNIALGDDPQKEMAYAFNMAGDFPLPMFKDADSPVIPYLPVPEKPGTDVIAKENVEDLGILSTILPGGVALHVKKTEFKKDRVDILVSFGSGKSAMLLPGTARLGGVVINNSGTGRYTKPAFDEALSSSSVNTWFWVDAASSYWQGSSSQKDTELLFQTLYSVLIDPAVRESVFTRKSSQMQKQIEESQRSVEGFSRIHGGRFLRGGDFRFGFVSGEELGALQIEDLQNWYLHERQTGNFEIAVVGDVNVEEIIHLANKYFGTLSSRIQEKPQINGLQFPRGERFQQSVDSVLEKSVITVAWPLEGAWSVKKARRLSLLSEVLDNRVRERLREALGAAYSPHVYLSYNSDLGGFGFIGARLVIEPGREEEVIQEIHGVAAKLAADGVDEESLVHVKRPQMTSLYDSVRRNSYWLRTVLSHAAKKPEKLDYARTMTEDYDSIGAEELSALAKRYLKRTDAAEVIITPES